MQFFDHVLNQHIYLVANIKAYDHYSIQCPMTFFYVMCFSGKYFDRFPALY